MRSIAAAAILALALAAPACADGARKPRRAVETATSLRVAVWPQGRESGREPVVRTLRCDPAGGTVRQPAEACRRLRALHAPLAPVPKGLACIEVYGGPGEALVTGRLEGRRIWARFRRTDGCQTRRWDRVAFLFAGIS